MRGGPFFRLKYIFTFFLNDNASAQQQLSEELYIAICHFMVENIASTYEIKPVFLHLFHELMEWQLPINMAVFYGHCGFFNHIQLR